MSRSPVLGIDLGTTNSVVAVADGEQIFVIPDENGEFLTPSAVSFHPSGEVLVGRRARDRRMVDAANTVVSVKRLIGRPFRSPEVRRAVSRLPFTLVEGATGGVMVHARGEAYSLPEISAFVLRRLKTVAESALGQSCVHAVVTVPANFNELQRTATRDAGRISGLNVLRILNEPTAAALAYGYGAQQRRRVAVYDLGGGTFDVSVLDLSGDVIEVVGTAGDTYLGGDDVDSLIADRMADAFLREQRIDLSADPQASARLRMAAEWLKCALSVQTKATATLEDIAHGPGGRPLNFTFEMARAELEPLCTPLFARTFDICEQALKLAGVRPSQLDAVVLVGGQTRTPQVRAMVAEYFGLDPLTNVDPDQVVAQGAALQALSLSGGQQRVTLTPPARPKGPQPVAAATFFEDDNPGGGFDDAPTRVSTRPGKPITVDFDDLPTSVGNRSAKGQGKPPTTRPGPAAPAPAGRVPAPPPPSGRSQERPSLLSTRTGLAGLESHPPGADARAAAKAAPKPPPLADVLKSVQDDVARGTGVVIGRMNPRPAASASPASQRPQAKPQRTVAVGEPPPDSVPPALRSEDSVPPALRSEDSVPPALRSEDSVPPALRSEDSGLLEAFTVGDDVTEVGEAPSTPSELPQFNVSLSSLPPPGATGEEPTRVAAPPTRSRDTPPQVRKKKKADKAPLLLDVTPLSLAIETVSGICEAVIARNSPIPTEQSRMFCTSQDNQEVVQVQVCQGEARLIADNQPLGTLQLSSLRRGPRGEVQVAVTFQLDADGTLCAKALDRATGNAQEIRINLVGALSEADVDALKAKQDAQYQGRV